jgi:hypothetical protein
MCLSKVIQTAFIFIAFLAPTACMHQSAASKSRIAYEAVSATKGFSWDKILSAASSRIEKNEVDLDSNFEVGNPLVRGALIVLKYSPEHISSKKTRAIFIKLADRRNQAPEDYIFNVLVGDDPNPGFVRAFSKESPTVGILNYYKSHTSAAKELARNLWLTLNGDECGANFYMQDVDLFEASLVYDALGNLFDKMRDGEGGVDNNYEPNPKIGYAKLVYMCWKEYYQTTFRNSEVSEEAKRSGFETAKLFLRNSDAFIVSDAVRDQLGVGNDEWGRYRSDYYNLKNPKAFERGNR